jgi:hypothetical protein
LIDEAVKNNIKSMKEESSKGIFAAIPLILLVGLGIVRAISESQSPLKVDKQIYNQDQWRGIVSAKIKTGSTQFTVTIKDEVFTSSDPTAFSNVVRDFTNHVGGEGGLMALQSEGVRTVKFVRKGNYGMDLGNQIYTIAGGRLIRLKATTAQ